MTRWLARGERSRYRRRWRALLADRPSHLEARQAGCRQAGPCARGTGPTNVTWTTYPPRYLLCSASRTLCEYRNKSRTVFGDEFTPASVDTDPTKSICQFKFIHHCRRSVRPRSLTSDRGWAQPWLYRGLGPDGAIVMGRAPRARRGTDYPR